ncbi:MAG: sulfite exporter TauE/SafE family protein [Anaerolineae bacterium]|uniref:TSUP family transporter n=1 Tax=Candidatus Amarolinea dominans TaxID=3140696 RepID=UPI0031351708|nr:sulfite exporter TauE/SafE family protein [Anaerolineae bacterium]
MLILYALNSLLRPLLTLAPTSLAQTAGRAGGADSAFVLAGAGVYLAGFLAGLLGGAYNTPGPPVIIYGTLQGWPRNEFRSILQALFLFSSALVIASTPWWRPSHRHGGTHYLIGLPALLLGVGLGAQVDRRLDHDRFRQVLNVMILLTGLVLIAQELSRKV